MARHPHPHPATPYTDQHAADELGQRPACQAGACRHAPQQLGGHLSRVLRQQQAPEEAHGSEPGSSLRKLLQAGDQRVHVCMYLCACVWNPPEKAHGSEPPGRGQKGTICFTAKGACVPVSVCASSRRILLLFRVIS